MFVQVSSAHSDGPENANSPAEDQEDKTCKTTAVFKPHTKDDLSDVSDLEESQVRDPVTFKKCIEIAF
jgi:hypothetical protein